MKTETKDSIFILLTTVKPLTSQMELLKQCKGINSFARSLLQQLENSFLINKNTDNETDNQI